MQGIRRASESQWGSSYQYFDTIVAENLFSIDCFQNIQYLLLVLLLLLLLSLGLQPSAGYGLDVNEVS
jgi:hypothetical protein